MNNELEADREQINAERRSLVGQLEDWLEKPMLVLGFVWLVLLVVELTGNLSPALELLGSILLSFRPRTADEAAEVVDIWKNYNGESIYSLTS